MGGATFEPVPESRDRELTLGPFMLTFIGCGLFVLCGLCFVFGYAIGRQNAEPASANSLPPSGVSAAQPANPATKPSAGQSGVQPPPVESADTAADADANSATSAPAAVPSAQAASAAEPLTRTALNPQAAAQTVPAAAVVQPALAASPSGIMVQIAAVSHEEDANVLVGALRKRGYAVSSRRDPTDGLLHVQVGPFANRTDAYAMRQKLLNDGYNAIVQP